MLKRRNSILVGLLSCFSLLFSGCSFDFFGGDVTAKLNFSKLVLLVDSGKQLSLSVENGSGKISSSQYSYTWSSGNTEVATVSSSGYVTAVDAGTTDIIANVHVLKGNKNITAKCSVTVTDPNPVSVKLNKETAEIQQGRYLQLIATVEHSANKKVVWSSNSSEITVDQTGNIKASKDVSIGTEATITAMSVIDPKKSASCIVTVVPRVESELDYTLMYYMCGSTLEYDENKKTKEIGLISGDIEEILSVNLPESVKIIIQTGGSKKWSLSSSKIQGATSISNTKLQRWEVSNGKIQLIDTLDNNKMSTEDSFESFLKWGLNEYDAKQMSVVLSGHGSGIAGCIPDDNNNSDPLTISEFINATKDALSTSERTKFTWLGFDCCMMQCADIASVASTYFDYMVASQQSEIGEGWDHEVYLEDVALNSKISPSDLLPKISTSFVSSFETSVCSLEDPCYQAMSVLDLSKMNTFVSKFNDFVSRAGCSSRTNYNVYKTAFSNSLNDFGEKDNGLVDLKDFVVHIASQISGLKYDELLNALSDLVINNNYCSKYNVEPCGLNAFFPESADASGGLSIPKSSYQGQITKFSNYQSMCLSFGSFIY